MLSYAWPMAAPLVHAGRVLPLERTGCYSHRAPLNRLVETEDHEGIVNRFAYDLAGNRTHVWDGLQQETQFFYDGQNRLTKQIFANADELLFLQQKILNPSA